VTAGKNNQERLSEVRAAGDEGGPISGVAHAIAVASGKGGVGKSTVAVNLACGLRAIGQRVGILDADVYGPSLPTMLGISGRPRPGGDDKVLPMEKFGLKVMSVGFFLDDRSPVIWRGPLVTGLLRQFLKDVQWGELDFLVIDMPPGTGDAPLTVVQQIALAGAVIVTTPQSVSLLDVGRGVAMFGRVGTPVLGVIENMSYYECPKCGKREDLFGSGGGDLLSRDFGVPLLGRVPVVSEVRVGGDQGKPLVVDRPDHPLSRLYLDIAGRIAERARGQAMGATAPRIVG